jgi:hypothetical protein
VASLTQSDFVADTAEAVRDVRSSLGALVAAVPEAGRRPRDLQRALKVNSKICWQIIGVIRDDDPLASAMHVPTPGAVKRVLEAANKVGVPERVTDKAMSSLRRFEAVVATHADSRPDFDAMVAAVANGPGNASVQLAQRRSAFRSLSHIWGTQLGALGATTLIRAAPSGTDRIVLTHKRGLRRLRPDAFLPVYGYRIAADQESDRSTTSPIEPEAYRSFGAPVMPEWSSAPLPGFRTHEDAGWRTYEPIGSQIGRSSDLDLAFGTLTRGMPTPRDTDGRPWVGATALITVPTSTLTLEVFVHKPSFGEVEMASLVFANAPGGDAPSIIQRLALPVPCDVVRTGTADSIAVSPDDPGLRQRVETACAALGWEPAEFEGYKVSIEYPVMHSALRLFFVPHENTSHEVDRPEGDGNLLA